MATLAVTDSALLQMMGPPLATAATNFYTAVCLCCIVKKNRIVPAKTLHNKTFQLFIELAVKREDGDAATSPSNSRLAALSQHR